VAGLQPGTSGTTLLKTTFTDNKTVYSGAGACVNRYLKFSC
jgi:hypothetical protein